MFGVSDILVAANVLPKFVLSHYCKILQWSYLCCLVTLPSCIRYPYNNLSLHAWWWAADAWHGLSIYIWKNSRRSWVSEMLEASGSYRKHRTAMKPSCSTAFVSRCVLNCWLPLGCSKKAETSSSQQRRAENAYLFRIPWRELLDVEGNFINN